MQTNKTNQIIWLSPNEIHPHPNNPRKKLGDLTELADSIRFVGVLQNLTVVPGHVPTDEEWAELVREFRENPTEEVRKAMNEKWTPKGYTVIIGHRRHAASKIAGVEKLPCIIADMDEKQQAATMLLENMQRSDLTMYEQAQGFQMMIDLGETQNSIAEKTGLSPATVSRRLKLLILDSDKLHKAEQRGGTLEDYIKASEIEDEKARNKVTDAIGTSNFNWEYRSAMKKQVFKEKMPEIKKELKAIGAKKDDSIYYWDSKYEVVATVGIETFKEGDFTKAAKKVKEKTELWWTTSSDTTVYLVKKKPKQKKEPVKKSEQEKRADELRKNLTDVSEAAYESRKEFLANFSAGKKYTAELTEWLWEICYNSLCGQGASKSWELLREKVGEKNERYKYRCERENLEKYLREDPSGAPAVILAALSGDSKMETYYNAGYGETKPSHKENADLDFIYKHICKIGYEMSDEEKALQNGTHELFETEGVENA